MDYLSYFNLTSEPFSHAPLPQFFYESSTHLQALERLSHAARAMKGLAVLVGDIGHGKTTLARRLLDSLPESEFEAAMLVIVHSGINANWLLKRIAMQLGVVEPADDKLTILAQLYERLLEIHHAGRRAVVLIDEAQMLNSRSLMEEFRGLLNVEVPGHKLISFIFFGMPSLDQSLALDPPLAQRVALRAKLHPFGPDDTARYIEHRLRLSGAEEVIFAEDATQEVHQRSGGVPRVINTLCDNVLLELFFARQKIADAAFVAEVAEALQLESAPESSEEQREAPPEEMLAVEGGPGSDAVIAIDRGVEGDTSSLADAAHTIAAQVAQEPLSEDSPVSVEPLPEQPSAGLVEAPSPPDAMVRSPQPLEIEDPLAFVVGPSASGTVPIPIEQQSGLPAGSEGGGVGNAISASEEASKEIYVGEAIAPQGASSAAAPDHHEVYVGEAIAVEAPEHTIDEAAPKEVCGTEDIPATETETLPAYHGGEMDMSVGYGSDHRASSGAGPWVSESAVLPEEGFEGDIPIVVEGNAAQAPAGLDESIPVQPESSLAEAHLSSDRGQGVELSGIEVAVEVEAPQPVQGLAGSAEEPGSNGDRMADEGRDVSAEELQPKGTEVRGAEDVEASTTQKNENGPGSKRFKTSSGRTIDLAEIDDLLLDLANGAD